MGKSVKSQYSAVILTDADNGNKAWVHMVFYNRRLEMRRAISFEELYYICKWIGECEDIKYPEIYQKGRIMVVDFITDAVLGNKTYNELAQMYKLPQGKMLPHEQIKLWGNIRQ